ncbi:MAG: HNH endonuclease, partial [Gordonia sp. (in: high G+C Gram-positive bacteria)]
MTTRTTAGRPASTVTVSDDQIVIRIARPTPAATGEGSAATSGVVRDSRADRLAFAARVDSFAGVVMWHRYAEIYSLLQEQCAVAEADPASDVFGRVYDPLCKVAASYAAAAGVRQCTAERFVERAVACA